MNSGTVAITNSDAVPLRLILEPWADEVVVAPGKTIRVAFSGPDGGLLQVEVKQNEVILYGWEGSTLSVLDDVL